MNVVIKARYERKYIGWPFREINWRKVDEYRAGVIGLPLESDGHSLQHAVRGKGA